MRLNEQLRSQQVVAERDPALFQGFVQVKEENYLLKDKLGQLIVNNT